MALEYLLANFTYHDLAISLIHTCTQQIIGLPRLLSVQLNHKYFYVCRTKPNFLLTYEQMCMYIYERMHVYLCICIRQCNKICAIKQHPVSGVFNWSPAFSLQFFFLFTLYLLYVPYISTHINPLRLLANFIYNRLSIYL